MNVLIEDQYSPVKVEGLLAGKKVVEVAAGSHHTVVYTESGEVFTFGIGKKPLRHPGPWSGRLGYDVGLLPQLVPRIVDKLNGMDVIGVAAGAGSTIVLTSEGVHLFGHAADKFQMEKEDKSKLELPEIFIISPDVIVLKKKKKEK